MSDRYNIDINPHALRRLEELIGELEKERKEVEKAWKIYREEFLKKFPFKEHPDRIDELEPEDLYNPGKSKDYFFYYVEHKLKALGYIRLGSAITWEMAINNLDKFKRLLKDVVSSKPLHEKIDAPWESIPYWGGDKIVAKKIIFLYDPENIAPIFKTEQAEHYVRQIGVTMEELDRISREKFGSEYTELTLGQRYQILNEILLQVKNSSAMLKELDNALFMRILSKAFPFPRLVPKPLKKEMVPLISGKPMLFSPTDELGVALLFGIFHKDLGFPYIVKVSAEFPDAVVLNRRGEIKRIEFEYAASSFRQHGHKPKECDYIVCWIDDLSEEDELKEKVISLKDFLEGIS